MEEQDSSRTADDRRPPATEPDPGSVSIVIPVHNEEDILRRTVEHIIAGLQVLGIGSFEIVLSENGSADATRRIADELARESPQVRVIALDRPDYGAALKAGFLAARGRFIV